MEVLPASRNKGEVCSCVGREVARTVQWAGPWKTERSKVISRNDSKTDRKQKTYTCVHVMSSFFNTVNTFVAANSGRIAGNENHIRLRYFMADEKLINWSGCVLLTCAIFIIKDNVWSLNPVNLLSEKRFKKITPQTMQIGKKNVCFFCHLWTCHLMSQQLGATIVCVRDQRIMLMPVSMPTNHDHGKEDAKMQKRKRGCLQTHNWQLRLMIKMWDVFLSEVQGNKNPRQNNNERGRGTLFFYYQVLLLWSKPK